MSSILESAARGTDRAEGPGCAPSVRSSEANASFQSSLDRFKNLQRAFSSLGQIADYIKQDTGWQVDVSRIDFGIVSRDQYKQVVTEDIAARLGYTIAEWSQVMEASKSKDNGLWSRVNSWIANRAMREGLGGVYLPSKDKIIFVEENLSGFNEHCPAFSAQLIVKKSFHTKRSCKIVINHFIGLITSGITRLNFSKIS